MLRVWWGNNPTFSGIVIGSGVNSYGGAAGCWLIIREDSVYGKYNGDYIGTIECSRIKEMKWVEVKAEGKK